MSSSNWHTGDCIHWKTTSIIGANKRAECPEQERATPRTRAHAQKNAGIYTCAHFLFWMWRPRWVYFCYQVHSPWRPSTPLDQILNPSLWRRRNGIMSVTLLYSALHSHLKISNNNNSNNKTTYAPLKAEVKKKNQPPFQVHVCYNVLRCSCDKPFCCASSRCSPPQRRALPRRVAPFSDTREAALLLSPPSLLLLSDTLSLLSARFSSLLLWCETQDSPLLLFSLHRFPRFPPQRISLCSRARAAARKHFMQIAVGVTLHEGEVIGGGGCSRAAFGDCRKKCNHDFNGA